MCKSRYGLHDYVEIRTEFDSSNSNVMKQFGCDYCKQTWWIRFLENGEPENKKLYAEIVAKDLVQPGTELFDEIYGRGRSDVLIRVSQEHYNAQRKNEQMREEITEFKRHHLNGAKRYAV